MRSPVRKQVVSRVICMQSMVSMPDSAIPPTHSLSTFEGALRSMRDEALLMASLADRNLENVRLGIFDRDEDACNTAIADDAEIDALEVRIDRDGLEIMLRYHPVASDLRNVIATMKLSTNLERIADQTVNIARRGRRLLACNPIPETTGLQEIFEHAAVMLKDAIRAFADGDIELARSLKERDKRLDHLNRQFAEDLTQRMAEDLENIPGYLDLIFVSRFLERIGDQSRSIGEDTVFAVSSEETRHVRPV
jgi:phosphate transport system protein